MAQQDKGILAFLLSLDVRIQKKQKGPHIGEDPLGSHPEYYPGAWLEDIA